MDRQGTPIDSVKRIEELQARVDELEAFAYSAAHELRTPLQSIRGFARILVLNDAQDLSQRALSRLRRIADLAEGMDKLVEDTLALARAQYVEMRVRPVALGNVVCEVVRELRGAYPATRILVSELPIVDADAALARQVLVNLVGNALKYSARVPDPTVEIAIDQQGALSVRDNGIGFDMQWAHSLFEPFQRLTADPAYPGTGVGLAICHRLLRRHGGWIRADSRDGGPTTFTFSFGEVS